MPYRMQFDKSVTWEGSQSSNSSSISADGKVARNPTVPAAVQGGTLTGRTDNDTGIVTMPAGHGFVTSDKVDIYWNVAGVLGSRSGMTATVAGNAVTVDGGQGDNLPVLNT